MFNSNIMINYLKNGNNIKNINNSNNKHIKNESNYLYFNNDYSKELLYKRNRVNIFEEQSKLINSRKLLNTKKNKEDPSKQNTFDKDTKNEKCMSFNYNNNINKNSRSHNKKKDIINKIRMYSLNENAKTITNEIGFNKKEEKNKTFINFNYIKNKNKDSKYIRCKKEIFEKVSKNITFDKFGKKNELEVKKIKLNEEKINNKKKKKAKSQVETENNIQKVEEKIKEKNKTEINKDIDSNKKQKIIEENKKRIGKENRNINDLINDKKEKKINNNKDIKKEKENKNKENIDKNNKEEEEIIINKDNIEEENRIKKEKDNDDKKENINTEKLKLGDKENNIIEKENLLNDYNLNYNYSDDEEESKLSYFDLTSIKQDIQIPKEYMNIIYKNLLIEEEKDLNPKPIYEKIKTQKEINEQMRSILVDWIIDVHYKFGFTDETLFMTVLIIDRYITIKHISKIRFQLLGITAMLIACKHEEINLPKIEDFIYITDNAYNKDEVFIMENDILNIFNFELLYPSPIKFYEYLTLKFNFDKKKFLMGKYLMESFLVDLKWTKYRPSVISCACAYIVMKFYKMENYQESYNRKYYNLNKNDYSNPNYSNECDIKECAKDICYFVDNINKSNYLSCKNKYANENNESISLVVEGQNS